MKPGKYFKKINVFKKNTYFFKKDANILTALLERLKDIGYTELKQGGICMSRFEMEAIQGLILGSTYLGTVHFHLLLQ